MLNKVKCSNATAIGGTSLKKILLTLLVMGATVANAQDVKTIKKAIEAKDFLKAKTAADEFVIKVPAKAESWYWKYKVYNIIANDSILNAANPTVLMDGFEALKKYATYEKSFTTMYAENITNVNGPTAPIIAYYNKFRNLGSEALEKNNFNGAIENLQNVLKVSKFLYDNKLSNNALDTIMTFYVGYAGMKGDKKDVAETYFKKITDANAFGTDLQIAYGWLANYYFKDKKDIPAATAIIEKGLKFYPKDDYLTSLQTQTIENSGDHNKIFANDEANIAKPTALYNDYLNYAVHLFGYLFDDTAVVRADAVEKMNKFDDVMTKGLTMKPNSIEGNFLMGMFNTQKTIGIDAKLKALKTKVTPADLETKKKLNAEKLALGEKVIKNFDFVNSMYRSKADNLKAEEKERYKIVLQNLKYFYSLKKNDARVKELDETLKAIK